MDKIAVAAAVKEHLPEDFYYCAFVDLPDPLRDRFPGLYRILAKRKIEGRSIAAWMDMPNIPDEDEMMHAFVANDLVRATELLLKERS